MSDPDAVLQEAARAFQAGRFADAVAGFQSVIRLHPDVAALHVNLGAALRGAGDTAGAEAAYRDAIRLESRNALAWFNLGNLLADGRRAEEALAAFRKADALQPGTPEILNNLGVQLYDLGAVDDALRHYDAALAGRPGFADALTNRGNALQRLCRMKDAEDALESALAADPGNAVYRLNKSAFLAANGRYADAIDWAERAIEASPDYAEAKLKLASLLIQQGRLRDGFALYESRWRIPGWHALADTLPMPAWDGGDPDGKRLLIWNEQGYGDAILYARYLPLLAGRGAAVTFLCEKPLHRLFRQSFGDTVEIADLDAPPPDADVHASVMSLPFLMGTTLETIPAEVPYLRANAGETAAWLDEIARLGGGRPAVGLIWAGNPGQAHDYSRSMHPSTMAPLLDQENVIFFNLLIGPRGNEWRHERLLDVRDRLTDFAATAALMAALDRIVSVDSAPAHLAGALGRPLDIALSFDPDSRYFTHRTDSPWYPTATLLRQAAPGDWSAPLARARTAVETIGGTNSER